MGTQPLGKYPPIGWKATEKILPQGLSYGRAEHPEPKAKSIKAAVLSTSEIQPVTSVDLQRDNSNSPEQLLEQEKNTDIRTRAKLLLNQSGLHLLFVVFPLC